MAPRRRRQTQAIAAAAWCCLLILAQLLGSSVHGRALDRPLPPPPPQKRPQHRSSSNDNEPRPPPPRLGRPDVVPSSSRNEQHLDDDETAIKDSKVPPRPPPRRPEGTTKDTTSRIEILEDFLKDRPVVTEETRKRPDPPEAGTRRPPPPRQRVWMQASQQQQAQRLHQVTPPQRLHQQPPPQRHHQQQQQQQQYQYVRPLPPQHRPQQQQSHKQQGANSALKSLWQRVERGLDGLAELEDVVTDRAKSFLPGFTRRTTLKALPPPPILTQNVAAPEKQAQAPQTTSRTTFGYNTASEATAAADEDEASSDDEHVETRRSDTTNGNVDLYKMMQGTKRPPEDKQQQQPPPLGANGGASASAASRPTVDSPPLDEKEPSGPLSEKDDGPKNSRGGPLRDGVTEGRLVQEEQQQKQSPYYGTAGGSPYGRGQPQEFKRGPPVRRSNPITDFNSMRQQRPPVESRPVRPFVDNDEPSSPWSKFVGILPPLPRLPSLSRLMGRGSNSYKMYADASLDAWRNDDEESRKKRQSLWARLFRRGDAGAIPPTVTATSSRMDGSGKSSLTPPITELLARSKHGNATCLLSDHDVRQSRYIGKSCATMDVVCLGFMLFGAREIFPYLQKVPIPRSLSDITEVALPELRQALASSTDTWAYFAFAAAFLSSQTSSLLYISRMHSLASSVGSVVERATEYGQLYLRLVASLPVDRHVPDRLRRAASSQFVGVVASTRLRCFVLMVVSGVVVMTVSMVRPIVLGILSAVANMVTMEQWRHWPLQWLEIGNGLTDVAVPLSDKVRDLIASELVKIMDAPLKLAFTCSVFLAVFAMSALPVVEQRRPVPPALDSDEDDEDEAASFAFANAEAISNLGVSSASRLGLLSEGGAPEGILERWRSMLPEPNQVQGRRQIQSTLRLVGYGTLSVLFASLPMLLHYTLGLPSDSTLPGFIHVDSVLESSVLLIFAMFLTWNAMGRLIEASDTRPPAVAFLQSLDGTVEEFTRSQQSTQMNLQLAASVSPTKGLGVIDLWAAHTAKRAWAVRGANLSCRNGEVVLILGDDSAGKSRLLTAISEAIVVPPRRSLSTTRVRGTITVGGVDVSKWDRAQVKRRLGLVLNDVRTVSDTAELLSGLTLEEILVDGLKNPGESHVTSIHEQSAMNLALQITGLSTTLLPRLPSKLSTVVSANEDKLMPSPLRPRCNALSPAEWSKLLLARVLTQTILDNDNPASSDHSVEKSLIGSLLLLDDVMVHMSEIEEAKLLSILRQTGAATVVTSHKWATGRFADKIVVVKDGAIVENGTHSELLARGPQHSIYAAKWHAMTTL